MVSNLQVVSILLQCLGFLFFPSSSFSFFVFNAQRCLDIHNHSPSRSRSATLSLTHPPRMTETNEEELCACLKDIILKDDQICRLKCFEICNQHTINVLS